jgi:hypothetical protein
VTSIGSNESEALNVPSDQEFMVRALSGFWVLVSCARRGCRSDSHLRSISFALAAVAII